jgi:UDP-N-acetyl-D-mannosaminuronate dehydrogenase
VYKRQNVHFLAFPPEDRDGSSLLDNILKVFIDNKRVLNNSLIVFQSAGAPGMMEKDFVNALHDLGLNCNFASAFRSDWTVEEYLFANKQRVIAADNSEALEAVKLLYDILGINYKTLSSISEAEVYENAKNSLQYAATVFINQLALAYPDIDIRTMTGYLLDDVELNESHLSIGAGGYKMFSSVQNILAGSMSPKFLSLIREAHKNNLSMIVHYAEKVKKMGCTSATILGLTVRGEQRNIELSPSVILAEYLNKLGLKVNVDDPFYNQEALSAVLPFCRSVDITKQDLETDALFIMTDHNKFKGITQNDVENYGISKAKIIIDNIPLFNRFQFSPSTLYHAIGDGSLGLM